MDSRTATALLILSSFLATVAATDIYLPSLPGMAVYFSSSPDALQATIAIYLFSQVFAAPIWGSFSDHFSRKSTLFAGMSIFLLGGIFCALSTSVPQLLTARFIQGIGAISAPVVGWATISELYSKEDGAKIMSVMGGVMTIIPLIAPMVGGELDTLFGWRANFLLVIIITFLSLLLMFVSTFEYHRKERHHQFSLLTALKSYIPVLKNVSFVGYVLVFALLCAGEFAYLAIAPFYLETTMGLSAREIGFFISIAATTYVIGSFGAPKISQRIGSEALFNLGIFCCAIGSFFLLFMHFVVGNSLYIFCGAVSVYLLGLSIIWGPATSHALQQITIENRGKASAARSLLNTLVQSGGAAVGGLLPDDSVLPLGLFFLTMSACSFIALKLAKKSR